MELRRGPDGPKLPSNGITNGALPMPLAIRRAVLDRPTSTMKINPLSGQPDFAAMMDLPSQPSDKNPNAVPMGPYGFTKEAWDALTHPGALLQSLSGGSAPRASARGASRMSAT